MADTNYFMSYSEDSGLKIKNKAEIVSDLKRFFQTAYGQDLSVDEGTEVYTFIDLLAEGLCNIAVSTKRVWDAFSFIGANGSALDILCSAFGISRKPGETDEQLRARYYISMFSRSVATVDGLKSQLLKVTDNENKIAEVAVYEYLTEKTGIILTTSTTSTLQNLNVQGNSIVCVVKPVNDNGFITDLSGDKYKEFRNAISGAVADYKSLGCLTYGEYGVNESGTNDISGYGFNKFYCARPVAIYFKFSIKWDTTKDYKERYETVFKQYITQNVSSYINNLKIGVNATNTGIQSCIFQALFALDETPFATVTIQYGLNLGSYSDFDKTAIGILDYLTIDSDKITWAESTQ